MGADEIIGRLRIKGYKCSDVAKLLGVSRVAVHLIVYGKGRSHRIQEKIAEIIGMDIEDIWPLNAA